MIMASLRDILITKYVDCDWSIDGPPFGVDVVPISLFKVVCMYVCMVTHIARVWINRVRLPILLVVS